ncbi:acyl-CoA--6-aminopenicillanic acid acyl-transferase [Tistrella bauzanensis]|uniref:Acyl-CoA--6-aminopenicillanic acid acyl-transferase n=1 Tax=Tistrella bauzanensis TaxID=657419 RepID=A0ABQ1J547_9PROT|nr:C45 family peptidase [Tistrella bauzanensis]GGB57636.1 acyl-CoA--6-aminopenicillanic acid acyl-transferase [Tistrella bauzanensis]
MTAARILAQVPQPVRATGGPRQRGRMIGQALKPALHAFLDEDVAHIDRVRSAPLGREQARLLALSFAMVIAATLPGIFAELNGMAEGADLPLADIMILQMRRELAMPGIGPATWPPATDISGGVEGCTTVAFRADTGAGRHRPLIAQTADLPGDLYGLGTVLHLQGAGPAGSDILAWAPLGQLGFLGINGAGLAIGINMVVAEGWRPGVPPYLIIRHLLSLPDARAAEEAIARLPRASSRCYTLADARDLMMIETTIDTRRRLDPTPDIPQSRLSHCNHFLHPDLAPRDRVPDWSSTRVRAARMDTVFASGAWAAGTAGADDARALLADHANAPLSICAHDRGPARGRTVATMVMDPLAGCLDIAAGTACDTPFIRHRIAPPAWPGVMDPAADAGVAPWNA